LLPLAPPDRRRSAGLWLRSGGDTIVIDQLRGRPGADELVTSVHPGPGSPAPFYRALGFEPTGDWLEDEELYRLPLERDPDA
jgi:diamine N-acetyltransferase